MILSVSRRTDIPTFYSEWFFNRIKEKYVIIRNPINKKQLSKINISPSVVDCIVFWTKNPKPMLDKLDLLRNYKYYFQFTLTSYGQDIEGNIPSKNEEIIETFMALSNNIGKEKVIWRYDPILLNEKYTIEYHLKYFEKIAKKLYGYTNKCIISFIDIFKKLKTNFSSMILSEIPEEEQFVIAEGLVNIANKYAINIETCAERIDLSDIGIQHAKCIDDKLISKIVGYDIKAKKDNGQRLPCGCIESIDIGTYNTCLNGCMYCYANANKNIIQKSIKKYSPTSPILCDVINENDVILEKKVKLFKQAETQHELSL